MNKLVVVDTSVFIEYLRGTANDALAVLTLNNQVLLSAIVRLELLAGVKKADIQIIEKLCDAYLPIDSFASLKDCEQLLSKARGSGLLGSIPDLLILADVKRYNALLFSYDNKMNKLAKKFGLKIFS